MLQTCICPLFSYFTSTQHTLLNKNYNKLYIAVINLLFIARTSDKRFNFPINWKVQIPAVWTESTKPRESQQKYIILLRIDFVIFAWYFPTIVGCWPENVQYWEKYSPCNCWRFNWAKNESHSARRIFSVLLDNCVAKF